MIMTLIWIPVWDCARESNRKGAIIFKILSATGDGSSSDQSKERKRLSERAEGKSFFPFNGLNLKRLLLLSDLVAA